MEISIKKWGNSLGIRIPHRILDRLKIRESQKLDIDIQHGKIVIKPITTELNVLLSQINDQNLHDEIKFGEDPVGSEIW